MNTNIAKEEIEFIKKNLGRYPYRGMVKELAHSLNRKQQNVWRSIVKAENLTLIAEVKRRAEQRTQSIRAN